MDTSTHDYMDAAALELVAARRSKSLLHSILRPMFLLSFTNPSSDLSTSLETKTTELTDALGSPSTLGAAVLLLMMTWEEGGAAAVKKYLKKRKKEATTAEEVLEKIRKKKKGEKEDEKEAIPIRWETISDVISCGYGMIEKHAGEREVQLAALGDGLKGAVVLFKKASGDGEENDEMVEEWEKELLPESFLETQAARLVDKWKVVVHHLIQSIHQQG